MKLLLNEMYPAALAAGLKAAGVEAVTAVALGLAGRSDADVFAAAVAGGFALLTENVSDFTRIAADYAGSGAHHPGLLVALSSRFSRRPAGVTALIAAIVATTHERLDDRVVYLTRATLDE
ncbi:MAG TPA: DUF5615 family PIN-like protein [Mycobacterium sp.]|nr:DUF5615 family PIN-like protein [Mycobacterium sp.]